MLLQLLSKDPIARVAAAGTMANLAQYREFLSPLLVAGADKCGKMDCMLPLEAFSLNFLNF
jgi:hypothetical protein